MRPGHGRQAREKGARVRASDDRLFTTVFAATRRAASSSSGPSTRARVSVAVTLRRGPEGVALHVEPFPLVGEPPRGGAVPMVDDRVVRHGDHATGQPQSPSQVHIVVVGEVGVVEAACCLVGRAGHGKGAAVRKERRRLAGQLGSVRFGEVFLEAARLEVDGAADEVNPPAVPAEHARGGGDVPAVDRGRPVP